MSEPTKMELAGIFRPRVRAPGFGIPVFAGEDNYWVQRVGDDGRIVAFRICDVEPHSLRAVPQEAVRTADVGQPALYSFEAVDGTITIATREQLYDRLRNDLSNLRHTPFVLGDVASFLGDANLEAESAALCEQILLNTRATHQPVEQSAILQPSPSEVQTPRLSVGDVVKRVTPRMRAKRSFGMNLLDLTLNQLKRAAAIKEQIEALNRELRGILGAPATNRAAARKNRTMSAATKINIAAARRARARWAKLPRPKPATLSLTPAAKPKKKKKKKRKKTTTMSPAARAKLSAKLKAFLAAKKAGKK